MTEHNENAVIENYSELISRVLPGAEIESVARLIGGVSADVYRLQLRRTDGGDGSVVLRVHGKTHSGHGAQLEFQLLAALHAAGVPVPEPLSVDHGKAGVRDPHLLMRFVAGDSEIPSAELAVRIELMAGALAHIHCVSTDSLPELPTRIDPLPEVFDFLPEGDRWRDLSALLRSLEDTAYKEAPKLLHGDFWPANLLWHEGAIAGILDWEDSAVGDPMADLAGARVELRYLFGESVMDQFTQAYQRFLPVDLHRVMLWQIYVAAAAQKYMGHWGLPEAREAHMRREALASIAEAASTLSAAHRSG